MNKIKLMIAILLALLIVNVSAQSEVKAEPSETIFKDGLSISYIMGLPPKSYGQITDDISYFYEKQLKLGIMHGITFGNRWYWGTNNKFRAGAMVNWFEYIIGTSTFERYNKIVMNASLIEFGPIFTFSINQNMGIDAFYNIKPGAILSIFNGLNRGDEVALGFGAYHAVGGAFRWKNLNMGLQLVFGKMHNINQDDDFQAEKLKLNGLRLLLGRKF